MLRDMLAQARLPGRAGHVPHDRDRRSCADLVLPAAGWGEKEGTFINSERRIGLIKKVAPRPGPGAGRLLTSSSSSPRPGAAARCSREWESPEAVFQILKRALARPAVRHHGIDDYRMLDERGGIQWPYPAEHARPDATSGGCSPTAGSITPTAGRGSSSTSRGRCPSRPTRAYPAAAAHRPRHRRQWHTQTRTAKSAVLRKLYPRRSYVEINPADARAARRRARPAGWSSSRSAGQLVAKAFVTHDRASRARSSCPCTTTRPTG